MNGTTTPPIFDPSTVNLTLFWRILVDPCCAESIYDVVKKEVGLWGQDITGDWHRFLWQTFDLSDVKVVCNKNSSNQIAELEKCQLHLENCYLEVVDPGLSIQAGEMGLDLDVKLLPTDPVAEVAPYFDMIRTKIVGDQYRQFIPEGKELYYVGENIRLEAEFSANGEGVHPVFYYPKYTGGSVDPGNVSVQEQYEIPSKRRAIWEVSPNTYDSDTYYLEDQHLLVMSQDQNVVLATGTFQPDRYFEFQVDTVPIHIPEFDDVQHLFNTGREIFYIGHNPDSESDGHFRGRIKRIMFDPHSSCGAC